MSNNKIANPKTEVPNGIGLNNKDNMMLLLGKVKDIERNYVIAMQEASNEKLFKAYKADFQTLMGLQRDIFELMFRKGWYVLEKVDPNKISLKYQTLDQEYTSLVD